MSRFRCCWEEPTPWATPTTLTTRSLSEWHAHIFRLFRFTMNMCILNPNMSINPVMNAPTCTHVQLKLHCQRDLMTITNHWCSFQYSVSIRSSSFGQLSWHFVTLERLYRFPHLAFFVSFSCVGNCFYWFVEKHEFNQIFLKPHAAPSALSVIVTLFQKFSVVSMGTTSLTVRFMHALFVKLLKMKCIVVLE